MSTQDDFPMSAVLHFPPSVYQKIGAAEMLPKLLESLKIEDLRCVQFLRNGRVRVSFLEKETRDRFLSEGMRFEDQEIPVTKDGQKVTVVYIRDLPYEVASDDVIDFFSSYGEVLTAERSVAAKFPSLCNGNRILKMILNQDLPYFLSVCGCQCRLWYRGQPIQCFVCREVGHRAQSCPLSGRCRCCHQVGHMARDCGRAWDPPPSTVDADDSSMSDVVTDRVPESDPVDKPRAPPVDKPPVDVPATNNSSVSEPAASGTASLEDDALSPGSNSDILGSNEPAASGTASPEGDALSSGSNSDTLGSNGALLFRQNLKRKGSHIAQDIWDRVTEDLAYAVSKKSRASFLEMSSSDLERFIVNASGRIVRNSSLFHLMLFSLTRFREALRNAGL